MLLTEKMSKSDFIYIYQIYAIYIYRGRRIKTHFAKEIYTHTNASTEGTFSVIREVQFFRHTIM